MIETRFEIDEHDCFRIGVFSHLANKIIWSTVVPYVSIAVVVVDGQMYMGVSSFYEEKLPTNQVLKVGVMSAGHSLVDRQAIPFHKIHNNSQPQTIH